MNKNRVENRLTVIFWLVYGPVCLRFDVYTTVSAAELCLAVCGCDMGLWSHLFKN